MLVSAAAVSLSGTDRQDYSTFFSIGSISRCGCAQALMTAICKSPHGISTGLIIDAVLGKLCQQSCHSRSIAKPSPWLTLAEQRAFWWCRQPLAQPSYAGLLHLARCRLSHAADANPCYHVHVGTCVVKKRTAFFFCPGCVVAFAGILWMGNARVPLFPCHDGMRSTLND